ncbi:hypothetical protein V5799_032942 [Amblyomma americanum]|uniref:Nlr family card domain protein n=1 Tax=Amblyomma americanum TaxID=6943 RepID=A0AAQ4DPQ9_AMBAM
MCLALRGCTGLKRLSLDLFPSTVAIPGALEATVISLTRLESLELSIDWHEHLLGDLVPLLTKTASLKTLRALNGSAHHSANSAFLAGLFQNSSITHLSLSSWILSGDCSALGTRNPHNNLGTYLKQSPSLRSVHISDFTFGPEVDVRTICDALTTNKVLLTLKLEVRTLRLEYAIAVKELLYTNKTLRYFSLTSGYSHYIIGADSDSEGEGDIYDSFCRRCGIYHHFDADHVKPWISALLENDTSITELKFSLWCFSLLECQAFCRAVTVNKSLKKIILEDFWPHTRKTCRTLSECGLQDRVFVESLFLVQYPGKGTRAMGCSPFAAPFGPFQAAVDRAAMYRGLTNVTLQVYSILCVTGETEPASTPIVQLIQRLTSIKYLVLSLTRNCCNRCWNVCGPAICEAVRRNPSIRNLRFSFAGPRGFDMAPVASLLHRSRTLRKFTMASLSQECLAAFFTELSTSELANNYALQDLSCYHHKRGWVTQLVAIKDILLRNRALAKRAARFVTGTRAKYTADAFEKVSDCSTLVDEVQATAFVEVAQAKELIARCALALTDFTEFMRFAGVVRDVMECSARDDGQTQLDDLPEACLRRIHHFLRLSDVLYTSD